MQRRFARLSIAGLILSLLFGCLAINLQVDGLDPAIAKIVRELNLPPRQDFRIVVISDLNSQYGSTEYEPEVLQAIALMPALKPDLVLMGGDAIAGQKASLTKAQIEAMWAAFDKQIAAPLRQNNIPFGFTIGNHDGSGAIKNGTLVFERERELAKAYWQQQNLNLNFIDRANFPFYYTFEQNEVFFLVWDASTAQIDPQQLKWIERSLSSKTAQQAASRIVLGHLPFYPITEAKNKPGEYLQAGKKLRSLLQKNRVLMYVSGHHHVYYPGRMDDLNLLHAGALGQGERQLIDSNLPPSKTITAIDLDLAQSELTYTTYNADTWKQIFVEQLPKFIPTKDGKIWRHDL